MASGERGLEETLSKAVQGAVYLSSILTGDESPVSNRFPQPASNGASTSSSSNVVNLTCFAAFLNLE